MPFHISPVACNADRAPAEASIFASEENIRKGRPMFIYISEFLLTASQ